MKKYSLLKVIGIFFLFCVLLTWIIPTGTFNSGAYTKGVTDPVGLLDLFKTPLNLFSNFLQIGLVFLVIGGFYGVLNKTSVYANVVNKVADKFKDKKMGFMIISVILFALLSSLTNLNLTLFVIVPFMVAVLLLLGYNKVSVLAATFGAILVGGMATVYGFNVVGYANYFFGISVHFNVVAKIVLFIISVALLILFINMMEKKMQPSTKKPTKKTTKKATKKVVNKTTKEEEKTEPKIVIPLYEKKEAKKKSSVPMVILVILVFIFALVAMYNWSTMTGSKFFENIYESLMGIKIGNYTIFANIIGTTSPFGYWGPTDLCVILIILSLLIGWIYSIKFTDIIDAFLKGAKEILPVALYAMLANIVFVIFVSASSGTLFVTIANFLLGITDGFNAMTFGLTGIIGSLLFNDYPYMLYSLSDVITTNYANDISLISFILQSLHGLMMLILPISVMLIAGLAYLNVSFKEWFKYIWKYLLVMFVVIIIIILVLVLI